MVYISYLGRKKGGTASSAELPTFGVPKDTRVTITLPTAAPIILFDKINKIPYWGLLRLREET